jgi:hypothetical protein
MSERRPDRWCQPSVAPGPGGKQRSRGDGVQQAGMRAGGAGPGEGEGAV